MCKMGQILLISCFVICVMGCRQDHLLKTLSDMEDGIAPWAEGYGGEQNIQKCIQKRKNKTLDEEPILISAILTTRGDRHPVLSLCFYDEDDDLLGFGIQEEGNDSQSIPRTNPEEYPSFIFRSGKGILGLKLVPVQICDVDQRKDIDLWNDYENGVGIDVDQMTDGGYWRDTLPPVYISKLGLHARKIVIYIYDKKYHKSNVISVIDRYTKTAGR